MANIRPLSQELQQKAIEELHEDLSRIPRDIQAIKDWLHHKKYINARTDDQSILNFLRGCKFSLERTKEKIETCYTMRTLLPEFFKNRNPFDKEIQEILKMGLFLPLPYKNKTSPRVILVNVGDYDASKIKKDNIVKVQLLIGEVLLNEDDQMIICGMQLACQLKRVQLQHVYPPALTMKIFTYLQECIPSRIKGIHMLNMPSVFEAGLSLLMSFLSQKLKNRVKIYNKSNTDEIFNMISKDVFPKEYGGSGPSLEELTDYWKEKVESYASISIVKGLVPSSPCLVFPVSFLLFVSHILSALILEVTPQKPNFSDYWKAKVESYAEWYKDDGKYGTETLRPGKPKTVQEAFGVEGVDESFRKLNVD